MAKYYHFNVTPRLSSHFTVTAPLAFDTADDFGSEADMTEMLIRAKVQSGDYIVTLITELERISVSQQSGPIAAALEAQIDELIYVDKHYQLNKRPAITT